MHCARAFRHGEVRLPSRCLPPTTDQRLLPKLSLIGQSETVQAFVPHAVAGRCLCNATSEVSTEHRGTLQTISWLRMDSHPGRLHAGRCMSTHRAGGGMRGREEVRVRHRPAQLGLIRIRPSVRRSKNGRGVEASERGLGGCGAWGTRWTFFKAA